MNTNKIIEIQNKVFFVLKNLWNINKQGTEFNMILDNFLDELEIKKDEKTRFIAYSRISELRVEPLELYLDEMQNKIEENNNKLGLRLPNKLEDKQKILNKAYLYVKRIYEDLFEKFIYELEKDNIIDNFHLELLKGILLVGKAFNNFMPAWKNIITKQNDILDKKFDNNSTKIMNYLRDNNLLDKDEKGEIADRCYSVLIMGKSRSYFEAFPKEIGAIIFALDDFIEKLVNVKSGHPQGDAPTAENYINYLLAIKNAFAEIDVNKLIEKWQIVDETWMEIKGPFQICHPFEFYEDKYRKGVAPEWDLRILDTQTLDSKIVDNIEKMYNNIYSENNLKFKYGESYNFSKSNLEKTSLYISEPIMFFGSELNGMFSAQVIPNDEIISARFGKKIFAFPKMVLEDRKKSPIMKLTKVILDKNILDKYLKIIDNEELFYKIYDIETIGHEFGHILFNTKDNEIIMNSKTGNFKNIEEFKATTGGLCSYFMKDGQTQGTAPTENCRGESCIHPNLDFEENLIIIHLYRCIGLLKYREVVDVLPYYNEALIHLEIMLESEIFIIKNNKIILNFSADIYNNLKQNYIKHYKKLINIYLEKIDAGKFLFDYVIIDKKGNNISKNKKLREFGEYYYNLYKKIGNEVV